MTVTRTALVADASAEVRRGIRETLHALGYLTLEAQNGFQLLDLLRKVRPALVVADLALRGLDGTEVLHFVRHNEDWMDIPVLVTSAMTDPATRKLVLQAGGTALLAKPVTPEALRQAVDELLLPPPRPEEDPGNRSSFKLPMGC